MHCQNLAADRQVGAYWEEQFCEIVRQFRRSVTLHQSDRLQAAIASFNADGEVKRRVLPDVSVWDHPTSHYEIKHKAPTGNGEFGLEKYRFDSLLWFARVTDQDVYYAIHDHSLSGGRHSRTNLIEHWFAIPVRDLDGRWTSVKKHDSWVNGDRRNVEIYYWPRALFAPLLRHLRPADSQLYVRLFTPVPHAPAYGDTICGRYDLRPETRDG